MALYHPPLTAFPIVFLLSLAAVELVRGYLFLRHRDTVSSQQELRRFLRWLAVLLLVSLAVSSVAAFASGVADSFQTSRYFSIPQEEITAHYDLARLFLFLLFFVTTLGLFRGLAPVNGRLVHVVYGVTLAVALVVMYLLAQQGGELVFTFGAGVEGRVSPFEGDAGFGIGNDGKN